MELFSLFSYAGFQEWPTGQMPGNPRGLIVPLNRRPSPWQPMIDLMGEEMKSAPVLSFSWRTRLLHPLYPYTEYVIVCLYQVLITHVQGCMCSSPSALYNWPQSLGITTCTYTTISKALIGFACMRTQLRIDT